MDSAHILELIEAVKDISIDAGKVILDVYENEADFGIESKSDDSPLTKADNAANDVICAGLEKLSTVYPILSEENKGIDYVDRKDFDFFWLVDPLDGTKEFIKRNGEFTVNIALIHNKETVAGVVYVPVSGDLFWAVKGNGAYVQRDGVKTKLEVNTYSMRDKDLGVVCSRSHLNEATSSFLAELNEPRIVSTGSSLKFLILAEGKADVYPRLAPTMEWDTGAAQIILEEAGGKVVRADDNSPLLYNKEILRNPEFIAYGRLKN